MPLPLQPSAYLIDHPQLELATTFPCTSEPSILLVLAEIVASRAHNIKAIVIEPMSVRVVMLNAKPGELDALRADLADRGCLWRDLNPHEVCQ